MSSPLRVVFMGTPEFSVPALNAIISAGHDVIAVYTRAPKPKGRGQAIQKSPIHDVADAHHIPVYTPASLRKSPGDAAIFAALKPDVAVVAAYGLILPPAVLSAPQYGCINIHASLLPRWRGASPLHHAILTGDTVTGVTIMQMEAGLDTGPMIMADQIDITSDMTTSMLDDALSKMGAQLIIRTLDDLAIDGHVHKTPQPDIGVTLAPMLTREMGIIHWLNPADHIDRQIRAFTPWPGTTTHTAPDMPFKIIAGCVGDGQSSSTPGTVMNKSGDVACGGGTVLNITMIQVSTGKKMTVDAAINGGYLNVGDVFQS